MFRVVAGAGFMALLCLQTSNVAAGAYFRSDRTSADAYLQAGADRMPYHDTLPDSYAGHIRLHRNIGAKSYTSPYALPDGSPYDEPAAPAQSDPSDDAPSQ